MQPHDLPALVDVVLRLADTFQELSLPYAIGGAVATSSAMERRHVGACRRS